ncbi:MAG: hypothetical protein KKF89_00560 [Nanoarchaeota archaeon]|nr:hypothetical protein [Nanoarchaeota archaeon]MBU1854188.1 hypothetical protein [Nanoarchaeota archaeon]
MIGKSSVAKEEVVIGEFGVMPDNDLLNLEVQKVADLGNGKGFYKSAIASRVDLFTDYSSEEFAPGREDVLQRLKPSESAIRNAKVFSRSKI